MGRHKIQIIEQNGQRQCTRCNQFRPIAEFRVFNTVRRNSRGEKIIYTHRIHRCKQCVKEIAHEQWIRRRDDKPKRERSFLDVNSLTSSLPRATYDWFFNPNYCYG